MPQDETVDADADGLAAARGRPSRSPASLGCGTCTRSRVPRADVLADVDAQLLGDRAWVMTGDDAVGAGLFGPVGHAARPAADR